VSKLYKVNDDYTVRLADQLCAEEISLKAIEGKRNRETKITVDRAKGKAHYLERDMIKNTTVLAKETDVPACVQDIVAGLYRMRTLRLEPGQTATIPVTDGKKFASVKIEAQERETVKTPTGTHKTIRHEAYLFNGVLYGRNARCLVWLTDDARRTPVQLQVRMRFLIGTITLTLEKEERTQAATGAVPRYVKMEPDVSPSRAAAGCSVPRLRTGSHEPGPAPLVHRVVKEAGALRQEDCGLRQDDHAHAPAE
jgi:hypothetical protein